LLKKKNVFLCAIGAGLATGLYPLFWNGWSFLLVLCFTVTMVWGAAGLFLRAGETKRSLVFGFSYLLFSFVFASIFMTPVGFFESIRLAWHYLNQYSLSDADVWPNLFLTVGEAGAITIKKLVFLTGTHVTWAVALFGAFAAGFESVRKKDQKLMLQWLAVLIFTIPLFMIALKTERFCILLVLPFSLLVTLGIEQLERFLNIFLGRLWNRFPAFAPKLLTVCLILIFVLPQPLVFAFLVSSGISPIMNDAWFLALQEIKERTAENSIINSWWPPGYFIVSLSRRGAIFDGGNQDVPESYWMGRALLAEDERQAIGFLRMVDTKGNEAATYLKSLGFDMGQAVDVISGIVALDKAAARAQLPASMPVNEKEHLLELTHGEPPPAYLFLYDDLVTQNLAVQAVGKWDFRRAALLKSQQKTKKVTGGADSYVQNVIAITNGFWKYSPLEATPTETKDGRLIFSNGLIVDLATMDAFVSLPQKMVRGAPVSLFYMNGDQLVEKKFNGERVDQSALLINRNGVYSAVIADRALIKSVLFRGFYLDGKDFRYLKPFTYKKDERYGTTISVFKIDWNLFENSNPKNETNLINRKE
jgi:asparagine N-glycosylation enzyme membrane subunit Stt3